jgi:putative ATP-binding cassette transporter
MSDTSGRIMRKRAEDGALRLRDVCVTLNDGNAVVNEADIEIKPGEKVLVVGESGAGKSTLVRAMAGLWPWGEGEISVKAGAKLFFMPQQPYVPLGTLARAACYPASPDEIDATVVRQALEDVGLGHFADRLDENTRWESILSGGEKQRLGFARLLIQQPDIVVMDEATAALDPQSQEQLMRLVLERLANATLISVGHRVELEAFHTRKLVLEYRPEGARLVRDESLTGGFRRSARFLSQLWTWRTPPIAARDTPPVGRVEGA